MSENTENQTSVEAGNQAQVGQIEAEPNTKVIDYEAVFKSNTEKIAQLENELKAKDSDVTTLKTRISDLEKEVAEAQKFKQQHLKEAEEIELLKVKSEDTLTRAKGIIFDKTKVIKNQELQIEALNQQIASLKDVVSITKDLLEIRNLEVKQLESKISCMEEKVAAEKERQDLMHKKLETMIRHNGELKREYETQLCLFSALRERYNERELAKGVVEGLQSTSTSTAPAANAGNSAAPASASAAPANTAAAPASASAPPASASAAPTTASAAPVSTAAAAAPATASAAPVSTVAAPVSTVAAPVSTAAAPANTAVAPVSTNVVPASTGVAPADAIVSNGDATHDEKKD